MRFSVGLGAILPAIVLAIACGDEAGIEGTQIKEEYAALSGGVLFASAAFIDSNDYDLYWADAPPIATINPQPLVRLTEAKGNEWQPSVSKGGNGFVFAREGDGIFLVSTSGRITRISETKDAEQMRDSLPSISFDGTKVAWVREELTRPIGSTGFFETYIMVSDFDGANQAPISPRAGIVQDAPVWEPRGAGRLAWSEFDATSIGATGPGVYGIYLHDLANGTGRYVCMSPEKQIPNAEGDRPWGYRCFGQHLSWPFQDFIITGQDLIEINLISGELTTIWPQVVLQLQREGMISPNIAANPSGFFPAFPLSVSYTSDRFIVDGVVEPGVDGENTTLAFFLGGLDGGGMWRLQIDGFRSDLDLANTNGFLFSLATPQLVP